jgi:hypothetical protein
MFNEQGWAEKLTHCRESLDKDRPTSIYSTFPHGTIFRRRKYYDGKNDPFPVAVLLSYVKADGTLAASGMPIPKGLLVGGLWYFSQ